VSTNFNEGLDKMNTSENSPHLAAGRPPMDSAWVRWPVLAVATAVADAEMLKVSDGVGVCDCEAAAEPDSVGVGPGSTWC
jgi:hypothetical protein